MVSALKLTLLCIYCAAVCNACFDVHPASATVSAGGWTMFNCSGPAGTHFRWFGENDASDPFTRVHLDSNNSPLSTEDYNVSTETHGQNAVSYLWIRGNWQTYQTVRLVQCRARCHCDNTAGVTVEYSKAAEFRVVDLPQPPPAMQPTDAASSFTENTLSVGQSRCFIRHPDSFTVDINSTAPFVTVTPCSVAHVRWLVVTTWGEVEVVRLDLILNNFNLQAAYEIIPGLCENGNKTWRLNLQATPEVLNLISIVQARARCTSNCNRISWSRGAILSTTEGVTTEPVATTTQPPSITSGPTSSRTMKRPTTSTTVATITDSGVVPRQTPELLTFFTFIVLLCVFPFCS